MNENRVIRCTDKLKGNLMVSKWIFTKRGRKVTKDMLEHPSVQKFLNKGYLELVEDDVNSEKKTDNNNNNNLSVPNSVVVSEIPLDNSKSKLKSDDIQVNPVISNPDESLPIIEQQITTAVHNSLDVDTEKISDNDSGVIITTSPEDPRVKTFMNIDESLEMDLKKLSEDLDRISKMEDIVVPEKKN